jgi:hypothetical protein
MRHGPSMVGRFSRHQLRPGCRRKVDGALALVDSAATSILCSVTHDQEGYTGAFRKSHQRIQGWSGFVTAVRVDVGSEITLDGIDHDKTCSVFSYRPLDYGDIL